jgi:hypothetical protein
MWSDCTGLLATKGLDKGFNTRSVNTSITTANARDTTNINTASTVERCYYNDDIIFKSIARREVIA